MPAETAVAEIEQAFFEYRTNFKEPITVFWAGGRQAEIINAVLKALTPWRVDLENIAWQQAAKNLREVQLSFTVPSQFASIQVGVAGLMMTALNPDWSRAAALIDLFQAGLQAVRVSTGQDLQFQQTTLGFHIRPPAAGSFRDTISKLVNVKAISEDASMFGISAYYNDHSFVIDASAIIQGGVFVKLIRTFAVEKQFDDMAKSLYADEEDVLRRLGLRLQ